MMKLEELVLKPQTREQLQALASGEMIFPADGKTGLLLYGTNGTGKTTTARLLPALLEPAISAQRTGTASELNDLNNDWYDCEQGENGAQLIVQLRRLLSVCAFSASGLRYIVLDEVDNLTRPAMSSLKTLMNTSFAVFVLTTNNLSVIERGVISRCHVLDFNAAPVSEQVRWAEQWLAQQGFSATAAVQDLVEACEGDMRDLRTDLQQLVRVLRKQQSPTACDTTNTQKVAR